MNLFNQIGIDIGYVVIGLTVIVLILFILIIVALSKNSKLKKKYEKLMSGADGKSLEDVIRIRFQEIDELKNNGKLLNVRMDNIDEKLLSTYQKMGIVKYDAFKEMGGKLSFALALLNEKNNGFIINSMHSSREGCYTYVKEIIKGESFITLADEEKQALREAMDKYQ